MGYSLAFQKLLEARDIDEAFLSPQYDGGLGDPLKLPDMELAVERILRAREVGEKVLVYGDYDADGVTASTVLVEGLEAIGVEVAGVMLPNRFRDGYGMNDGVLVRAQELGAGLIVTVDCGSGNEVVIAECKKTGIDVVVTDHHECPAPPRSAVAVVNPKRADSEYGYTELAGVGVAYKLVCALAERVKVKGLAKGWEKWLLDLVAVGTICDSMSMRGENRALTYYGMKVLGQQKRVGLKELLRVASVKTLDGMVVGFVLGPRINAAGRLDDPSVAYELMRAKSRVAAVKLAKRLDELNGERRVLQDRVLAEAEERTDSGAAVIVVSGKWHEGVLGIVAGRLVEIYQKPAFVLSEAEDGMLKGSARSFGEFSLAEVLEATRGLLVGGGGHAMAAGVRLEVGKLGDFTEAVNEYYRSLNLVEQERWLRREPDVILDDLGQFDEKLYAEVQRLAPFGEGNEEPIWRLSDVLLTSVRRMGASEKHLSLELTDARGRSVRAIAFVAPEEWLELRSGERVDVDVKIERSGWRGTVRIDGRIIDVAKKNSI